MNDPATNIDDTTHAQSPFVVITQAVNGVRHGAHYAVVHYAPGYARNEYVVITDDHGMRHELVPMYWRWGKPGEEYAPTTPPASNLRQYDEELVREVVWELAVDDVQMRVHDGEEWACPWTSHYDTIMAALGSTETDVLHVKWTHSSGPTALVSITFVWGNGPGEAIADYSDASDADAPGWARFMDNMLCIADQQAERANAR